MIKYQIKYSGAYYLYLGRCATGFCPVVTKKENDPATLFISAKVKTRISELLDYIWDHNITEKIEIIPVYEDD